MDLEKEIIREEKKVEKSFKKINVWTLVSAVLAVVLIVMILWPSGDLSAQKAGEKIVNFLNANVVADGGVALSSVNESQGVYIVTVTYGGKNIPLLLSKDARYTDLGSGMININSFAKAKAATNTTTSSTASTTDKDKCSQDAATRFGLDSAKIEALAFSTEGINLLKADEVLSTKYGVSGSPTLVINGVQSSSIYAGTDAVKSAICSSFTTLPKECAGVTLNTTGVKKTAKPEVELFVMSYCPYGVRAETNIEPVQQLFGDKISLNIRFIVNINGNTIDSVQSLHGSFEVKEDARQLAIMQLYPDKYWTYLKEFNNVCYGGGAASSGSCG